MFRNRIPIVRQIILTGDQSDAEQSEGRRRSNLVVDNHSVLVNSWLPLKDIYMRLHSKDIHGEQKGPLGSKHIPHKHIITQHNSCRTVVVGEDTF